MTISKPEEIREALKVLPGNILNIGLSGSGAGFGFMHYLWSVPGISKVLSHCYVNYSMTSTFDHLGFKPDSVCCADTALELAMRAFYTAYEFGEVPTIGLGITASVASTREHRGEHRIFVSAFGAGHIRTYYVRLRKGVGEEVRAKDGLVCDLLLTKALFAALKNSSWARVPEADVVFPDNVEAIEISETSDIALGLLLEHPYFRGDGTRATFKEMVEEVGPGGAGLYPGAFYPPHFGHFGIEKAFEQATHLPTIFTIDAGAPHKSPLSVVDLVRRAKLLRGHRLLVTKDLPLYIDKAEVLPGYQVIMGSDAFRRMLDPVWGVDINDLRERLVKAGTRIVVADRMDQGFLRTLDDLRPPEQFPCERLAVRFDISSSEIRASSTARASLGQSTL